MASVRFSGYSQPMNNKKHFLRTKKTGFVLGAVLLVTLTKCVVNADGQSAGINVGVNVSPPVVSPVIVAPVVVQDDYVYYPNYGVYYNSYRHQYAYLQGGAWVSAPAPGGVSVDVLRASPSVKMDFHDSPARHHAEMVHKYPKNWAPSGSGHDQR
jgi:hypothetical protein